MTSVPEIKGFKELTSKKHGRSDEASNEQDDRFRDLDILAINIPNPKEANIINQLPPSIMDISNTLEPHSLRRKEEKQLHIPKRAPFSMLDTRDFRSIAQ